jgi:triacylglycerol esterase/lipase EstA (alpha/beta hydrolase family)
VDLRWFLSATLVLGCGSESALDSGHPEEGDETDDGSAGESGGQESAGGDESDSADGGVSCDASFGTLPVPSEGEFVAQGEAVTAARDYCEAALHATAGAADSTLTIELSAWSDGAGARLRVEDLLGNPIVDWTELDAGDSVDVPLVRSGEVLLRLEPQDPEAADNEYSLSVRCSAQCGAEYTRYPVVMMHGMAGTNTYINVLDYWFRLPETIDPTGFLMVVRAVDAFNGIEDRSLQWKAHLDALVADGVGRRFNLIGHSQGGLDARYLTSLLDTEGRIASVMTVASPHAGSAVADLATGAFDAFNVPQSTVDGVVGVLGGLLGTTGNELTEQLRDLGTDAMAEFNLEVLDVPGVYYSSWSGRSCAALDLLCQAENSGEIIDPIFAIPFQFMSQAEGENDGITGVLSCQWGEWMGTVPADHMDEVGQIADLINLSFDHRAFYLQEIRRLAELGY